MSVLYDFNPAELHRYEINAVRNRVDVDQAAQKFFKEACQGRGMRQGDSERKLRLRKEGGIVAGEMSGHRYQYGPLKEEVFYAMWSMNTAVFFSSRPGFYYRGED